MHFADQEGMSKMEFHGGSTIISVLIIIFVLIGMYLIYHFIIKKCKPFDPNSDLEWRRHAANHAALTLRRLEDRNLDTLRYPAEASATAPAPSRRRDYS